MKYHVLFGIIALWPSVLPGQGLVDTSHSPSAAAHAAGLTEVHWTDGFWGQRFQVCRDQMVPHMWDLMEGTEYKPFFEHFKRAAGISEGGYHGAKWNDGDFYKWLEAAIVTAGLTGDPAWRQRIDQIIKIIAAAQREDGYIHTPVLIAQRNGDPEAQPFHDRFAFEMYNMGHLLTAACVHHRVTGQDNFLNIARKTADFLEATFREPTPSLARNAVCPSHYMGMIELYRLTRETRYLELAKKFITMRDLVATSGEGGDDNQDRLPFHRHEEVMGHAVRANYLYAGVADLYLETGDSNLWNPLQRLWQNLVEKKMYITGGCGALYDGASPDGSKEQQHITRVHQAYGRNYQLPNTTAHNETCANIGNVLWNWRMFLASGEVRYVDVLELALYNSVLSGVSLEGSDFFYVNPLRTVDPLPVNLRWSRQRVPFVTSFCCPPNVVRVVAQSSCYAYAQSKESLWVNLYGSNIWEGDDFKLRQDTDFPWDSRILLTMEKPPEQSFGIKLRIPAWTTSATIHVNGRQEQASASPGTYHEIRRQWKEGDTIELNLETPPVLMESHPLVEETRNHVAIKRGPLVYCLESIDLPADMRIEDVRIPQDMELAAHYDDTLLQGVTVLEGNVRVISSEDWQGTLFRPLQTKETNSVKARFIPYYAWANRGQSEMSVWLPLAAR